MEIIDTRNVGFEQYKNLDNGTVFEYEDCIYIKTYRLYSDTTDYSVFNVTRNCIDDFDDECLVIPLPNAKLVI